MLPNRWENRKLGEVCRLLNGRAYKKDELLDGGTYPVLRVGNFFTNDKWYYSTLELGPEKYCDDGDLLYAWSASFGPRIWQGGKVIYHYHIWKLEPDIRVIDRDFLFYFLEWDVEQIKSSHGSGSTMIHVTKGAMEERSICLPPLDEQRRIAEVLRSVDEAIAATGEALKATRQVFASIRDELLESARRDVDEIIVANAITKNRGHTITKLQTSDYLDEGAFPIIDQGAAFICGYTDDAAALWPYALPVVVFGDHTRILKFVDFPFAIGADGTQCMTSAPGVDARYLYYALQSLDLRGEGYARHFKLLKEKSIPVPDLHKQVEIADQLFAQEKSISAAEQTTQRLLATKRALLFDLLSGRVPVPA